MTQKTALLTLLGIGTVGSGVAGSVYYFSKGETVADKLNKDNFALIKEAEGYQVAFKELKEDTTFINEIEAYGTEITKSSKFDKGGEALNKWCNAKLKESLSAEGVNSLIEKVKQYCKNRPLTIAAKLKKKLLTNGWNTKLASLKSASDTDLLQDLQKADSTVSTLDPLPTDNKAEKALEKWCGENFFKKLIQDEDNKIYAKVEKRCLENN